MGDWWAGFLRCAVSGVLMLAGTSKIYPFTDELAKNYLAQFKVFATVYPLVPLGYQPEPQFYLHAVGWLEAVSGVGLMFASGKLQKICWGVLTFIMLGSVQTMFCLKEYGMMIVPLSFAGALGYIYTTLPTSKDNKKKNK